MASSSTDFASNYVSLARYYLPLWIFISTPLLYLVLGIAGMAASVRSLARTRGFSCDVPSLLPLMWFFLPVAMVVVFRPTLYDGWRQLYFIYPALLLLSLRGFEEIRVSLKSFRPLVRVFAGVLVFGVVAAALGNTVAFMVRNHPLQNLFFSSITGGIRGAEGHFELGLLGRFVQTGYRAGSRTGLSSGHHRFISQSTWRIECKGVAARFAETRANRSA